MSAPDKPQICQAADAGNASNPRVGQGVGASSGNEPAANDIPVEAVLTPAAASPDEAAIETHLAKPKSTIDLIGILSGVEETAYTWDMTADRMAWESNAPAVLGVRNARDIATGANFQFLIAAEHVSRRQGVFNPENATSEALALPPGNPGSGIPYRVQYRFLPGGRRASKSLWIEDHGRWWPDENGLPAQARGVVRVINERYQEEQRLLYRSDYDELTGQLNRTRLTEALAAVLQRVERTGQTSAFLVASVNNLSMINETFGFDVGDDVIAAVGRAIHGCLRGGDTIGRYSANKFGIILNECGPGSMQVAAERFIKAVREKTFKTSACSISATISIGGVIIPEQAHSVALAISRALQALDSARNRRNDIFIGYQPSPAAESARLRNISIADEVNAALDENRMKLVLQPIVASNTLKPAFYECLIRMVRPDGTLVGAAEFIEIAEQLGMSRLIDHRTLELAIGLLKKHGDLTLSLNVSSMTCSDPDWLVALQKLTGGQPRLTRRLIVEITETTAIHDLDQTIAFVDTLKEYGCRVAIDDFGAGYTSFSNLKHFNADLVKIDGGFVKNLVTDPSDRIFIKMMAELSAAFGMETVAEWVTDEATADIVKDLGITYMQGFHFGKPMEVREIEEIGETSTARLA